MSAFNDEEENSASLQFGKEFNDTECLMNDEVLVLLAKKSAESNE